MKYTVKYKRGLVWRKIKNVTGDGYIDDRNVRFFILEDGRVVEMSIEKTIFIFPKERGELANERQREENN